MVLMFVYSEAHDQSWMKPSKSLLLTLCSLPSSSQACSLGPVRQSTVRHLQLLIKHDTSAFLPSPNPTEANLQSLDFSHFFLKWGFTV